MPDGFLFELSLLRKGVPVKPSSHCVKPASEDAAKPCRSSLCPGPDASSPRMAELPPSGCKAQLVWETVFVSCHLEREQSDKRDSLETSFSVFVLTMHVEHKASDTFDKT